ncbi:glutamate--tRNA ligase [Gehongia tenuis]|uniref:Glutamate--tRNA ligase n=1 Tax=Gehongia tenuis TaxID=2763655 RepID=A0A926D730_9FIRM|nr:glutamate--tRNA ligase [Gehongia tenuis]MBC8532049.1 glutamate--tRNA ligase [Gehongia tenuis]
MVRTRFAPSPTGYMHIGNLRSALYAYLFTKHEGGTFILRVEDTDQQRYVEGATELIYRTLRETGIFYDEGPDVGGEYGPYIQSERRDIYKKYAEELIKRGRAYYCFCTKERLDGVRQEMEARGETFKYDKHCLSLTPEEIQAKLDAGEPYVIRQNLPESGTSSFDDLVFGHIEVDVSTLDDMVLLKSDGLPTYNFANVVDDHLMKITHVFRGTEYLSSTPKYNLLYEAFGWEIPKYVHMPPVMRDASHKLSKRDGDASFEDFIKKGYLKEAIVNYIALLGWNPGTNQEKFTLEELVQAFSLNGMSKSPAIFDVAKLTWLNGEYVRELPFDTYFRYAKPWLEEALQGQNVDLEELAVKLQPRTEYFSQLPSLVDFIVELPEYDLELYTHKKMKTNPSVALFALEKALPVMEGLSDWTLDSLHDALMALPKELGVKNGQVLWPVRVALTGKEASPGGAMEMAMLLGREKSLARMKTGIEKLKSAGTEPFQP